MGCFCSRTSILGLSENKNRLKYFKQISHHKNKKCCLGFASIHKCSLFPTNDTRQVQDLGSYYANNYYLIDIKNTEIKLKQFWKGGM